MFDISLGMSPDSTGIENIKVAGAVGVEPGGDRGGHRRRRGIHGTRRLSQDTCQDYSAGMLLRLAFAIATLRQPEILLLDEIIGVGDASFMAKAKARLEKMVSRAADPGVSSHSDSIIRDLCEKVIWLDKGNVAAFGKVMRCCRV